MTNITMLPNWKNSATAEERFGELSIMARLHPEKFSRVLVVYEEDLPDGKSKIRWVSNVETSRETVGMLSQAITELSLWSRGMI